LPEPIRDVPRSHKTVPVFILATLMRKQQHMHKQQMGL
jgi:hypothetical protein